MEIKVYRDTKITIGLTEEEASQLLALLAVPGRNVLPIADQLYDALLESEVGQDDDSTNNLDAHLCEVYST